MYKIMYTRPKNLPLPRRVPLFFCFALLSLPFRYSSLSAPMTTLKAPKPPIFSVLLYSITYYCSIKGGVTHCQSK